MEVPKENEELITLKSIIAPLGITERQARKILRSVNASKQHQYFWLFTKKEAQEISNKLRAEIGKEINNETSNNEVIEEQ